MNSFQSKLKVKAIKADLQNLQKGLDAYHTAYDDAMARIFGQEKDYQDSARRFYHWCCAPSGLFENASFSTP
jgi:hypothetical protein